MTTSRTGKRPVKRPIVSPLRYPGGKSALYETLRSFVRANDLTSGTYVEPYAGGAGAALGLLVTGQVNRVVINDLDPAIFAFWKAVTTCPQEFARLVERSDLSVPEWSRQKEIYHSCSRDDYLKLGFATFYLNRTNRSGVLNGGPIGGMDQSGNYKIDARFNRKGILERLRMIALHAKRISVTNLDGVGVIKSWAEKRKSFIYADPPYYQKAGTLYLNSFSQDDHATLADCLNGLPDTSWLLTYDNVPQVREHYRHRRRRVVALNYSAHRVSAAEEVMVLSDALVDPAAIG